MNVQYRVVVAKKDERIAGPDDADIVITAPIEIARLPGFDATVEYMRGKVKAAGHAGRVLDLLKSGAATTALAALAAEA
ncbi:MAG TPA: hypothetical protein VE487_07610 [Ilumatobacter sp.]|jgi:hypothetical protein|nr:hypothetical protein [Ilumatobacter sp.]